MFVASSEGVTKLTPGSVGVDVLSKQTGTLSFEIVFNDVDAVEVSCVLVAWGGTIEVGTADSGRALCTDMYDFPDFVWFLCFRSAKDIVRRSQNLN